MILGDSLAVVVARGDLRASLEALRDRVAATLDDARAAGELGLVAPLSRQLADVLERLAAIPDPAAAADDVESAQGEAERILRAVQ